MYRYTTPTIGFTFPESVTPSEIVEIWMTIRQKDVVINKTITDLTQDTSNPRRYYAVLTEEDTSKLVESLDAYIQVRANINGTAVSSNIKEFDVNGVLREGEILP